MLLDVSAQYDLEVARFEYKSAQRALDKAKEDGKADPFYGRGRTDTAGYVERATLIRIAQERFEMAKRDLITAKAVLDALQ